MSVEKQRCEALRWLRQAGDDLEAARALEAAAKYAQAAFFAQQAGEKALRAVWLSLDTDPWGYSLGRLVREMPIAIERKLVYELAVCTRPDVRPSIRKAAPVPLPKDISLSLE
jgi:HEPN domain-containing protein